MLKSWRHREVPWHGKEGQQGPLPWWGPSSDLPNGAAGGDQAPWPREELWVGGNRALWWSQARI